MKGWALGVRPRDLCWGGPDLGLFAPLLLNFCMCVIPIYFKIKVSC